MECGLRLFFNQSDEAHDDFRCISFLFKAGNSGERGEVMNEYDDVIESFRCWRPYFPTEVQVNQLQGPIGSRGPRGPRKLV